MDNAREWALLSRDVRKDGGDIVDGAVILSEVMAVKALFEVDPDRELDRDDFEFYGELVTRMVKNRISLGKLQVALKKVGLPAGGRALVGTPDEPAPQTPPAPPLTEEQQEEERYRKMCALLKQPYHTPEERAEQKRQCDEANARYWADVKAGRRKTWLEEFGADRN
jgi:hypothetical protein